MPEIEGIRILIRILIVFPILYSAIDESADSVIAVRSDSVYSEVGEGISSLDTAVLLLIDATQIGY